ncbi:50S ribosomal protein L4 [Candidatus Gottesmanbacteria bacterium]|nr:50S ribosomal protein L4 [Candidatus Gottesmanbacteria bacterium]
MASKTKTVRKSIKKSVIKAKPAASGVSISVVDAAGKAAGKMTLPVELFGATVNKPLLAQAVRVYLANQRSGTASTKTRGEVEGSTRKIYKQKGTGRARHGAIRAPVFVGGGIVFGPKPRDYSLKLPKAMKKVALASALTSQLTDGNVIVVDGLSKLSPKTKFMAKALTAVGSGVGTLLVTTQEADGVVMAGRNLAGVDIVRAPSVNAYTLLAHKKIVFMKEAIKEL